MANNLRVFNTNSEYQSADLVHPAVSYVIETDKVHYEPTPPTPSLKWKATYQDSHVESAQCDSSSAITEGEINRTNLVSIELGSCVRSIYRWTLIGIDSLTKIVVNPNNTVYDSRNNCNAIIETSTNTLLTGCISTVIPNNVTAIGDLAFQSIDGLTSIDIPNSVTYIGRQAFYGCSGITSLDIPDSVTSIGGNVFSDCYSLTSVTIGSGITSIGNNAFSFDRELVSITIKANVPPSLSYAALDETNNCQILVPCESVNAYKSAWSQYASRITCIQPSFKWKAILSNGTTQSGACTSNTVLNGNSLPTSTVNLEVGDCVTELSNFEGKLNRLSSCTISDSVTKIGGSVFYQKHNLKTVVVGSGCTSIGRWAFNQADRLESLTFKSIVPPTLGDYVFVDTNNCPIYVPSASLTAYQTASGWSQYKSRFLPIP